MPYFFSYFLFFFFLSVYRDTLTKLYWNLKNNLFKMGTICVLSSYNPTIKYPTGRNFFEHYSNNAQKSVLRKNEYTSLRNQQLSFICPCSAQNRNLIPTIISKELYSTMPFEVNNYSRCQNTHGKSRNWTNK